MTNEEIRQKYFSARDVAYEKYAVDKSDAAWAQFEADDAALWDEMKDKMAGEQREAA